MSRPGIPPDDRSGAKPSLIPARERLAGFWNSWFSPREIERARALAKTASEDECQTEIDRLNRERDSRLEHWRSYQ